MVTVKCAYCGKPVEKHKSQIERRKNIFCSRDCAYNFRRFHNTRDSWKGGTLGTTTGYVYITINKRQIGEHILVAEKKIGRRLRPGEVVHHINGDRTDNRPENLVVMTNADHVSLHRKKERDERVSKQI